jgi:hypothetical protein
MSERMMRFFSRASVYGCSQSVSSRSASPENSSSVGAGCSCCDPVCCAMRRSISRTCSRAWFHRRSSSSATSRFLGISGVILPLRAACGVACHLEFALEGASHLVLLLCLFSVGQDRCLDGGRLHYA